MSSDELCRPMSEFDPSHHCWVHEQMNDISFAWEPKRVEDYRRDAICGAHGPGVVEWDGLLLDGWWPQSHRPANTVEGWPWL